MEVGTHHPNWSLIVPMFREAQNVDLLWNEIRAVVEPFGSRAEVILVDDGSDDDTFERLVRLRSEGNPLKIIRLTRNFGQSASLQAGIDRAEGEWIVTMDGDLQNDPRDIPKLLEELKKGNDLVVGWRRHRQDDLWARKLPSWIANRLIARLTGVRVRDNGCALKAFNRRSLETSPFYVDKHRYAAVLVAASGARYSEIEVNHRPRKFGESKYGFSRTWRVLLDLIGLSMVTRCMQRPSRWFGALGAAACLLAIAAGAATFWQYRSATAGDTFPIVFSGAFILFSFAALHLLLMAAIGELIVHTGRRNRPQSKAKGLEPLQETSR